MYLVDTSAWLDYYRNIDSTGARNLTHILNRDEPFSITGVIYQELLQGTSSQSEFQMLEAYFSPQIFVHPLDPVASYRDAAQLYFRCRRAGVTIRSTSDCLIAQVAIEHNLLLLHSDQDFIRLANVAPELKLA